MRKVGLRDLKNRLSAYIRLVRRGHIVLVTDRGQVVAELRPPVVAASDLSDHSGLAGLAKKGLLTLGAPNEAGLYPAMPSRLPAGRVQRLLEEERAER
ncbi:MAG: type II toxin-antitoxin system prevent-host-death family antitoxin [Candidatus Rokubacteria bacterium]|nr:type II toxin-antitoxin system prevent-host-death family antitoxin [Candidatus Rokubacteria bacterium]